MQRFQIRWPEGVSRIEFFGPISMSDIDAANSILSGDERYYSSSKSIWDFTRSDMSTIEPEQIYTALAMDLGVAKTLRKFNLALVVTESHGKHLCDCYIKEMKKFKNAWRIQMFPSVDLALEWLRF